MLETTVLNNRERYEELITTVEAHVGPDSPDVEMWIDRLLALDHALAGEIAGEIVRERRAKRKKRRQRRKALADFAMKIIQFKKTPDESKRLM